MSRAATEQYIIKEITKTFGKENGDIYTELFKGMNNAQFDAWIARIRDENLTLQAIVPNFNKVKHTAEEMIANCRRVGFEPFQRIKMQDQATGIKFLTPIKYTLLYLPIRRQAQLLAFKNSIPKNTKHVDEMSGQVTGASKGSRMSQPELLTLYASGGHDKFIEEMISIRGGKEEALRKLNTSLIETGVAYILQVQDDSGDVRSLETFKGLLLAAHLEVE